MLADGLNGGFVHLSHQSSDAFRPAMRAIAMPGTVEQVVAAYGPFPLSQAEPALVSILFNSEILFF